MSTQVCPKCKGENSKSFERCSCIKSGMADKGCLVCKGSGKAPCYTCNGSGVVNIGNTLRCDTDPQYR